DRRHDLVAPQGHQLRQALAQQGRVLGDHDTHGILTSTVVGPPRGLCSTTAPPWTATRSASPVTPVPRRRPPPPTPSSVSLLTSSLLLVPVTRRHSRTRSARACRTALATSSATQK